MYTYVYAFHDANHLIPSPWHLCLHASAGTAENWRDDYKQFKSTELGKSLPDWKGERYVDIRKPNVRQIMAQVGGRTDQGGVVQVVAVPVLLPCWDQQPCTLKCLHGTCVLAFGVLTA